VNNEVDLRALAVEIATSLVGLSSTDDPFAKWARLLNLTPPLDETDLPGFIIAGVWKSLGVSHRRLEVPLDSRHSVFRLAEVAMDCGAWRCRPKDYMPLPGDVALLGDGSPEGAQAFLVAKVRPGDPMLIRSIEGRPDGVQSRVRSWVGLHDSVDGRLVLGWIDVTSLPMASRVQS
jgi:hypothetical protein